MERPEMSFEEFKDRFMEDLPKVLPADVGPVTLEQTDVSKLQNESYQGVVIRPEGSQVGVTLDMNRFYEGIENGRSYDEILNHAVKMAEKGIRDVPQFSIEKLSDYGTMKEKLSIQVVDTERNTEMLEKIPHKDVEDMSMVCRFILGSGSDGNASILVNNQMLDTYGITQEQLFDDALRYAPEIKPFEIINMQDIMAEMMGVSVDELGLPTGEAAMYVASSTDRMNGAGVITYPEFMDEAVAKLGGDFFVLPSSVHEVILVPDNGTADYRALEDMVREVNETQVAPAERLSDNVYHYDSKDKVFERADKFDARKREKEANRDIAGPEKKSIIKDLGSRQKEVTAMSRSKADNAPGRGEVAL